MGLKNPDYEENCEKGTKRKRRESEKEKKYALILKIAFSKITGSEG